MCKWKLQNTTYFVFTCVNWRRLSWKAMNNEKKSSDSTLQGRRASALVWPGLPTRQTRRYRYIMYRVYSHYAVWMRARAHGGTRHYIRHLRAAVDRVRANVRPLITHDRSAAKIVIQYKYSAYNNTGPKRYTSIMLSVSVYFWIQKNVKCIK